VWDENAGDVSSAGGWGSSLTKIDRSTCIFAASAVARVFLSLKSVSALLLSLVLLAGLSSTTTAQLHQSKLFIDDGTSLFTIIKSLPLSGGQSVNFPNAGGTDAQIVLMKTPFDAANAWQAGDLLFASATGNSITRLPKGADGKILTIVGGLPQWADPFTTGGTVTSVDITVPSFLSVSGGPITTSGTFAIGVADQTGNTVFSSPADGSSGPPTFRTLVPSDIPNLSAAKITSGVLSVAQGGTGQSSLAAAIVALLPDTTSHTDQYLHVMPGGGFDWSSPSGGGGGGSVTSVDGSGGTTGLTLTGGPITTSGTLTLGGTLEAANGGTGQQTYTAGDILYASGATTLSKLPVGTTNQVLGVSAGAPAYVQNGATITNTVNSPAGLTGNTNNYPIDGSSTYIRLNNTSGGPIDLTGIDNTSVANGRVITLVNISSDAIVIKHHSGQSSLGNQFDLPGASDIILGARGTATFTYDQTAGYWNLTSTN